MNALLRLSIFVLVCISVATDARPPSPPVDGEQNEDTGLTTTTVPPLSTLENPVESDGSTVPTPSDSPDVAGEVTAQPGHVEGPVRSNNWWADNIVVSDEEYQNVLDRLRAESKESITYERGNYVEADADLDTILRRIEEARRREAQDEQDEDHAYSDSNDDNTDEATETPEQESMPASPSTSHLTGHQCQDQKDQANSLECAICLNNIEEGQYRRKLKCEHIFHIKCIENWFSAMISSKPKSCPLCRQVDPMYPLIHRSYPPC